MLSGLIALLVGVVLSVAGALLFGPVNTYAFLALMAGGIFLGAGFVITLEPRKR